ncbi:(d)CMP kinase [Botrimarina hoheduenensis]|uniref:Cytidylate kinase n=1 Tax=Botrimarina hoheduenensis TaxID=2528000 RepID=A0A5C5WCQ0_9BACT|nr:(d)CMP kinase [Botrimarina hoheduenensis]TWT48444.1 Cytidylate kinase [Botrimarina hoheduenensis]
MIVTIDGPAGAGKSSASRALAARLGFRFLDTGAMYRAVTLAAVRRGVDLEDEEALAAVAADVEITLDGARVLLNGEDVTRAVRTFEITTATRYAADNAAVRARLVEWQREWANETDVVAEGRDQSTVVFPHAECKIFLTASEGVRAERRFLDLVARGEHVTRHEVLEKQQQRDSRDCTRTHGPLVKAPDAIEVSTDGLSPAAVVDRLLEIVERCRPQDSAHASGMPQQGDPS